jgi:hypothetical protein
MSAYGCIVADGIQRPRPTNEEYMYSAFEQVFRQFRAQDGHEALARRLEGNAQSRFDLLRHSRGPVFCHDDLQQGNVLTERSKEGSPHLTGLIDFGNARAGDALFDLAKALFCCTHEDVPTPIDLPEWRPIWRRPCGIPASTLPRPTPSGSCCALAHLLKGSLETDAQQAPLVTVLGTQLLRHQRSVKPPAFLSARCSETGSTGFPTKSMGA